MRLPPAVRSSIDESLDGRGLGRITETAPVAGGCISETARLRTSAGESFFLKWSAGDLPAGLFGAEATSLRRIAESGAVRVPEVVEHADADDDAERWLLLEWLEPGPATSQTWTSLGEALSTLHRERARSPGWPSDNFIGSLPQENDAADGWADFWRLRRIEPQLRRARDAGQIARSDVPRFDRLMRALDDILDAARDDGSSLLHGDLWSGNVHVQSSGVAAVVDPAAYFGHREVDLAMAELFGGFDPSFYAAYRNAWPLQREYDAVRRPTYQLYYLLVHVNLFGGSYAAQTLATLKAIGF